jgi:hypothetical protein
VPFPKLACRSLRKLIKLEVAAFHGGDRHVDKVGRRPYALRSGMAIATVTAFARSRPSRGISVGGAEEPLEAR